MKTVLGAIAAVTLTACSGGQSLPDEQMGLYFCPDATVPRAPALTLAVDGQYLEHTQGLGADGENGTYRVDGDRVILDDGRTAQISALEGGAGWQITFADNKTCTKR